MAKTEEQLIDIYEKCDGLGLLVDSRTVGLTKDVLRQFITLLGGTAHGEPSRSVSSI